jgi:hypothetical protein
MKSFFTSVLIITLVTVNLRLQGQGSIIIGKVGKRTTYSQNGKILNHQELGEILKINPASVKEYKKCEAFSTTGAVFVLTGLVSTCTGVVFTGLSIVASINDNHDESSRYLTSAGITLLSGLGLITVGAVVGSRSTYHKKNSVNDYNNSLKTGRIENTSVFVGFTGNGVGVRVRF